MTDTQIGAFLRECVVYEEDSEEGLDLDALYGLYISWCVLGNKIPVPDSAFRTSIRLNGVKHHKRDGNRYYPGLRMVGAAARDYVLNSVPAAYEVSVPPVPLTDDDEALPAAV
ncbi:hypothetical protein ACIQTZ_05320 [Paenarthrobacter sp. NPDC090520]|uniref:hypothetical protein n=1 Tax=Paenarthrobacter sp. NPDC090520 TaxID=3364382 RepID=UPI00381CC8F3